MTLVDEGVPNSRPPLLPWLQGGYSFDAVYSGDPNYHLQPVSAREPFTVKDARTTATTLFDATTNAAWTGSETAGAKAYDTSTVAGAVTGFAQSGTVTCHYRTRSRRLLVRRDVRRQLCGIAGEPLRALPVAAVVLQAVTAPATTPPASPPVTSPTIAFTGVYIMAMWEAGLALLTLGGLFVLFGRRRRPWHSTSH